MEPGELVFAQLMDFIPWHNFGGCIRRYGGDHCPRGFTGRDQSVCMAFAQCIFRESLGDIEMCLRTVEPKLDDAGFRRNVSRKSLVDANCVHDGRMFADFAQALISRARKLYLNERIFVKLDQIVCALDGAMVDLCLGLFPLAKFRRRKGKVKLLDLSGRIFCFIWISNNKMHDVTVFDHLPIELGAFYAMDRGYVDFRRLH
jgi:Domain of unknown function (DUF4372)